MAAASNRIQITPDTAAVARPIHAKRSVCIRKTAVATFAERKAGSATTARNIKVLIVIAVAAKCIARMTTKGTLIPAPNQSMGLSAGLLADLKAETAVRRVRVR